MRRQTPGVASNAGRLVSTMPEMGVASVLCPNGHPTRGGAKFCPRCAASMRSQSDALPARHLGAAPITATNPPAYRTRQRGRMPIWVVASAAVMIVSAGAVYAASRSRSAASTVGARPPTTKQLPASTTARTSTSSKPTTTTVQSTVSTVTTVASPVAALGRVWAPSQRGYGTVRPPTVDNGGDPTGLVTEVQWQSWGGPQATGQGTTTYVSGGQGVANGTQERATVVAFNLGMCQGNLAYQAVEWYFPQHGQTFNPNQYINICTGSYVGQ
jgi:hypothetical protein